MALTSIGSASASTATVSSPGASGALGNEDTFLQLLVAQLKNQDPLQPADGIQFVTQLAQFSELEQVAAMRTDLDKLAATPPSSAATISN